MNYHNDGYDSDGKPEPVSYDCEACQKPHGNEWSLTCGDCDHERESGDLMLEEIES